VHMLLVFVCNFSTTIIIYFVVCVCCDRCKNDVVSTVQCTDVGDFLDLSTFDNE